MFSSSPDENLKGNIVQASYPGHYVHLYHSLDRFDHRPRTQH
jgi:hypothetical protein